LAFFAPSAPPRERILVPTLVFPGECWRRTSLLLIVLALLPWLFVAQNGQFSALFTCVSRIIIITDTRLRGRAAERCSVAAKMDI